MRNPKSNRRVPHATLVYLSITTVNVFRESVLVRSKHWRGIGKTRTSFFQCFFTATFIFSAQLVRMVLFSAAFGRRRGRRGLPFSPSVFQSSVGLKVNFILHGFLSARRFASNSNSETSHGAVKHQSLISPHMRISISSSPRMSYLHQ